MSKWIVSLSLIGFSTLAHAQMSSEADVTAAAMRSPTVKLAKILEKSKEAVEPAQNDDVNGMVNDVKLGNSAAQNFKENKIALRF